MNYQTIGKRETQEDSFLDNGNKLAVADGLGGHPLGDEASQCAIRFIEIEWDNTVSMSDVFKSADAEIQRKVGSKVPRWESPPATTLLTCWINETEHTLEFANAGDCTGLVVRGGQIVFQTARGGRSNIVTRYLGDGEAYRPSCSVFDYQVGDTVLLFTDGFDEAFGFDTPEWRELTSKEALLLVATTPLQDALVALEALTRARGSTDNATIVGRLL